MLWYINYVIGILKYEIVHKNSYREGQNTMDVYAYCVLYVIIIK